MNKQSARGKAKESNMSRQGGLVEDYREMSLDREREAEAEEWSEGLINDATEQETPTPLLTGRAPDPII